MAQRRSSGNGSKRLCSISPMFHCGSDERVSGQRQETAGPGSRCDATIFRLRVQSEGGSNWRSCGFGGYLPSPLLCGDCCYMSSFFAIKLDIHSDVPLLPDHISIGFNLQAPSRNPLGTDRLIQPDRRDAHLPARATHFLTHNAP